jgi:hypothetical protein
MIERLAEDFYYIEDIAEKNPQLFKKYIEKEQTIKNLLKLNTNGHLSGTDTKKQTPKSNKFNTLRTT